MSVPYLPPPLSGLRDRLRSIAGAIGETRESVIETERSLNGQLNSLRHQLQELQRSQDLTNKRIIEMLRAVAADEPRQRSLLYALRRSDGYDSAFSEPEPLISVILPTYDRPALLRDRAIPSVLAQTYHNFELVVVGDAAAGKPIQAVLESFNDSRISFFNLPYRGPYPDEPRDLWHTAGIPPFNEGMRRARGSWIATVNDDDALRPDHLRLLLARARQDRLEVAYGDVDVHRPDGSSVRVGGFPPAQGRFTLQGTLFHAGLAPIFPAELTDALFALPWDWSLGLRMTRVGVWIGWLDAIVADGYPSALWEERPGALAP